jgi:hypothetical protein
MEENIQLVLSILTLAGVVFAIYSYFRNPDITAEKNLAVMKAQCDLKHANINENIFAIKENHLRHLESDVSQIKNDITKILTILDERNKKYGN